VQIPSGLEVFFKPYSKAGYMDALFFLSQTNFFLQYGADHIWDKIRYRYFGTKTMWFWQYHNTCDNF